MSESGTSGSLLLQQSLTLPPSRQASYSTRVSLANLTICDLQVYSEVDKYVSLPTAFVLTMADLHPPSQKEEHVSALSFSAQRDILVCLNDLKEAHEDSKVLLNDYNGSLKHKVSVLQQTKVYQPTWSLKQPRYIHSSWADGEAETTGGQERNSQREG